MTRSGSAIVSLFMVAMALALLWGCAGEPPPAPPSSAGPDAKQPEDALRSEAAHQLDHYGIDYRGTLAEAESDDRAMRRLFLASSLTDGAGSDDYAGGAHALLKKVGEKRFVTVLRSVPVASQESVLSLISYDAGIGRDIPGLEAEFARRYPAVWGMMNQTGNAGPRAKDAG